MTPEKPGDDPLPFAADIAAMTRLQQIACRTPDLPRLVTATFTDEGATVTPWLFCRPVTALLMWVKALPGPVAVRPSDHGGFSRLTASVTLDGTVVTFEVTTHVTGITPGPAGLISRTDLARIAAGEAAPPDLSAMLDTERIRAPHAPGPDPAMPIPASAQTSAG